MNSNKISKLQVSQMQKQVVTNRWRIWQERKWGVDAKRYISVRLAHHLIQSGGRIYDSHTDTELYALDDKFIVHGDIARPYTAKDVQFSQPGKKFFHNGEVAMTVRNDEPTLINEIRVDPIDIPMCQDYLLDWRVDCNPVLFHNNAVLEPDYFIIEYKGPVHVILYTRKGKFIVASDSLKYTGIEIPKTSSNILESLSLSKENIKAAIEQTINGDAGLLISNPAIMLCGQPKQLHRNVLTEFRKIQDNSTYFLKEGLRFGKVGIKKLAEFVYPEFTLTESDIRELINQEETKQDKADRREERQIFIDMEPWFELRITELRRRKRNEPIVYDGYVSPFTYWDTKFDDHYVEPFIHPCFPYHPSQHYCTACGKYTIKKDELRRLCKMNQKDKDVALTYIETGPMAWGPKGHNTLCQNCGKMYAKRFYRRTGRRLSELNPNELVYKGPNSQ